MTKSRYDVRRVTSQWEKRNGRTKYESESQRIYVHWSRHLHSHIARAGEHFHHTSRSDARIGYIHIADALGANAHARRGAVRRQKKRYADCGNGTVTDTMTGLIWLKQATCLSPMSWEDAKKAVAALKDGACMLTDGSSPGDWRLPTQTEWEATMKNALALGCTGPTLTNDAGNACITAGPSSFTDVEADYYWSSTLVEGNPQARFGDIDHGHLLSGNLINTLRVWPVRGGQP